MYVGKFATKKLVLRCTCPIYDYLGNYLYPRGTGEKNQNETEKQWGGLGEGEMAWGYLSILDRTGGGFF